MARPNWTWKLNRLGEILNESFVVAKDSFNGSKQFALLRDAHDILKKLHPFEGGNYYEYLLEGKARVVYYDLDIKGGDGEIAECLKDRLIQITIDALLDQFNIQVDLKRDLLIYTSHGEHKLSYHILIRSCRMDFMSMRRFCVPLIEKVRREFGLTGAKEAWLDSGVYKSKQQMRLLGSTKMNAGRPKIVNEVFSYNGTQIVHEYPGAPVSKGHKRMLQLRESLISDPGLREIPIVEMKIDDRSERSEQTLMLEDFSLPNWVLEQFDQERTDNQIFLKRRFPGHCPACRRKGRGSHYHENQNAKLWQDKRGNTIYTCYHGPSIRILKGNQSPPQSPPQTPVELYNERWVREVDPEYSGQLIQANMGTGKTHAVIQFINKNRIQSAVVITPRQSFAREITRRLREETALPVLHYMEDGVIIPEKGILIVQYESLRRLESVPDFDLLLWDEITSSNSVISSSTMGSASRFRKTMDTVELLFKSCRWAIGMDAFIDSRAFNLFGENTHFSRNEYQPNGRSLEFWENEWWMIYRVVQELQKGKNLYTPCTSVKFAQKLHRFLEYRGYSSLCISGDNSPQEKQRLQHCNELFQQYRVVIVTSTITVGLDFNVPHFDRILVFADCRTGVSARDVLQMIGRVRTVQEETIEVYCRSDRGNELVVPEAIEQRIIDRIDTAGHLETKLLPADMSFNHERHLVIKNGERRFEYEKNWYSKIHVENLSEKGRNKNNHLGEFERLCREIGYGFRIRGDAPETEEWTRIEEEYREEFKHLDGELERDDRIEVENFPTPSIELVPSIEQRVASGEADRLDMIALRKYHVEKRFISPPSWIDFQFFEKHREMCRNAIVSRDNGVSDTYLHDLSIDQNPLRPNMIFDRHLIISALEKRFDFSCIGRLESERKVDECLLTQRDLIGVDDILNDVCGAFELSRSYQERRFESLGAASSAASIVGKAFKNWTGCISSVTKSGEMKLKSSEKICGVLPKLKRFKNHHEQKVSRTKLVIKHERLDAQTAFDLFLERGIVKDPDGRMNPNDARFHYECFVNRMKGHLWSKQKFWRELSQTVSRVKNRGRWYYRLSEC